MKKKSSTKENTKGKGRKEMNPAMIKAAMEMIKSVSDLSKTAIDASDPEKYARGVNELNKGVSETYTEMRNIIVNDEKLSTDEKLERLKELADGEAKAKAKCDEAIKGNREHISKIILEVFAGLLTCGISFAPTIVNKFKQSIEKGTELPILECSVNNEIIDSNLG